MNRRQILLLINTKSRKGSISDSVIREKCKELGLGVVNDKNYEVSEFCSAIDRYAHELDAVVVAGGDGSLNACLPAMLKHKLTFGIIPLGTSNNLARNLKIPLDLDEAIKIIRDGKLKQI